MSRAITVKLSRVVLIRELQAALEKRENSDADYQKKYKAWEKECAAANKKLWAELKAGKLKTNNFWLKVSDAHPFHDNNGIKKKHVGIGFEVELNYPSQPKKEYEQWSIKTECEEIRNALKLLSLSTEEIISTSTYKSVAKYL